ncbi:alpha-2,8-sialyltransferase 8F-like isoform X2 [Triplophysa dalaica]|uniref:alpha-2,8-sialyltransferase 8F-like isoform X2 n=1 Tax=Triplophysa dalaica TaxID=1582913 RepID=UPI0024DF87CB|nr:alpha-2,8-sialyltransferase 8F-like isoform X2 [Triplophysa dalaica]
MAVLVLRWIFSLLTVIIISQSVCLIYNTSYSHNTGDAVTDTFYQLHCSKLREQFSSDNIKPAQRIDIMKFTQDVLNLMNCPYRSNTSERASNKIRLNLYCNATGSLFLTKHNTAINEEIPYETEMKLTHKIDKKLHNMFPEDFPWTSGSLGHCAVVGSGGILQNSSCGPEIDSADFVISYKDKNGPDRLVKHVSVYGNAHLILPAFAFPSNTKYAMTVLQALQPVRPQQPVVFFSPSYLRNLANFWKSRGLKVNRLSTGFMMINVALEVCEDVHVYGFWPFDIDPMQRQVPHHYYDNRGPSHRRHRMPEEFLRLLRLHSQGALTLHLQSCAA